MARASDPGSHEAWSASLLCSASASAASVRRRPRSSELRLPLLVLHLLEYERTRRLSVVARPIAATHLLRSRRSRPSRSGQAPGRSGALVRSPRLDCPALFQVDLLSRVLVDSCLSVGRSGVSTIHRLRYVRMCTLLSPNLADVGDLQQGHGGTVRTAARGCG